MQQPAGSSASEANALLRLLPSGTYAHLVDRGRGVALNRRDVLFQAGGRIEHVYFPRSGMVSFISTLTGSPHVEVGTVGFEGMAGLPVVLGTARSAGTEAMMQIPGSGLRVESDVVRQLFHDDRGFRDVVLSYTEFWLVLVSQGAACNRHHTAYERCARWLLLTHDRVGADELPLTHEFLSMMVGARRAGVTVAVGALEKAGLVEQRRRGLIAVLNRQRLERTSCECYGITRSAQDAYLKAVVHGRKEPGAAGSFSAARRAR